VHRFETEGLEDQHVQGALDDVGVWFVHRHSREIGLLHNSSLHIDCQDVMINWNSNGHSQQRGRAAAGGRAGVPVENQAE
jgi:hypothetical protein